VPIAAAARAGRGVVLERRVAAGDAGNAIDRRDGERRASKIRVKNDAGRIDGRLERGTKLLVEASLDGGFEARDDRRFGGERAVAAGDRRTHERRRRPKRLGRGVGAETRLERAERRALTQLVDRRDDPEIGHEMLC